MQAIVRQVKLFLANFPGTTLATGSLCYLLVLLYIFQMVTETDSFAYCLSVTQVFFSYRVFHLLTAPFFHSGFWHLLFNVVALLSLGPVSESQKGSILFSLICILLLVVSECLFLLLELLTYLLKRYVLAVPFFSSCVVGISGLLFGIFVIDCNQVSLRTFQLLGRIPVSSKWLPWIFLILIQAMLPDVSFLGHFCGIVAGYLYVLGGLNWILPSCDTVHRWDSQCWFASLHNFVAHNDICCSATPPNRRTSHFILSYQSLCPSRIQNWLPWKRNSLEETRFPGRGYRLGTQNYQSQLLGKQVDVGNADDKTSASSKTEDYGSVSINVQTE